MAYDIGPKIGMDGEAEFRKQLTDINNVLKTLDTELKKVASEFRDNAQGQDALVAKNRVLTKSISEQKKKIEEVKRVLAFATSEYGETANQTLKWQQVLNRSEATLNDLTSELRQNEKALQEMKEGLRDVETGAKKTDAALNSIDPGKLQKLSAAAGGIANKLSGTSKAARALGTAVVGAVPATQEFRRDLSFLAQNAKQAGVGMGSAEKAFKTFNEVSGETDSSIEGVSNLLQAGFTKSNLQKAVEGLAGAATRFPDTLKIEGLADGLQETLATGKAIGPFAELLDRVGIGADKFSEELEKCTTEAEKQNLVLETLSEAGLNDSYEGWKKSNKELVDYENAMLDAQTAISELATTAAPLVTTVVENLTKLIEGFNGLPKPVQAAAGGVLGFTAAASPVISVVGNLATGIGKLKNGTGELNEKNSLLTTGTNKLFGLLKDHPYAAVAAGAVGLGFAIKEVVENINAETTAAKEAAAARQKSIENITKESENAKVYAEKLRELSEVENKTSSQKELMQSYVDRLNESVEDLNLTYDEEKDKLNQTTDAILTKIDAQKQEALQTAYVKAAEKAYEDYAEAQLKADEIGSEFHAKQEKWNKLTESEKQVNGQLKTEVDNLGREYDDAKDAARQYAKEAQKLTNQAAIQSGEWKKLTEEAKKSGIKIPKNLVKGIKEGKYAVPTTIDELNKLIEFQKAIDNAGTQGQKTVEKLTNKLAAGEITVEEATEKLTKAMAGELEKGSQNAGTIGGKTVDTYSDNVKSKVGKSREAGKANSDAANTGMGSADTGATGTKKATEFNNAIVALKAGAKNVGVAVSNAAKSGMDSVDTKPTGKTKGDQFNSGMGSKNDAAKSKGTSLAKSARSGAADISFYNTGKNAGQGYINGTVSAIKDGASAVTEAADYVLNKVKKNQKINSPSKKWEREAGEPSGEGYIKGLRNKFKDAQKVGIELANLAMPPNIARGISIAAESVDQAAAVAQVSFNAGFDYELLASMMSQGIFIEGRQIGRALREAGVVTG